MEYSTAPRGDTGIAAALRRRRALLALLPLAAALQLAAAASPSLVERLYSQGVYRVVAATFAATLGRLPFSLGELALAGAILFSASRTAGFVGRFARARGRRLAVVASALRGVWVAAGALYLAFLFLWGFNYRRRPYAELAGLDVRPAGVEELSAVCAELVDKANTARDGLAEGPDGVVRLADGRSGALRRAPAGYVEAGRLYAALRGASARGKPVVASSMLSYLGISGIFCPFTGEANVNMTVPEPDVPFAASHELAHAHGFAREDEANYLGYLACTLHPDADFRYSGRLGASLYAMGALARADRRAHDRLDALRSPGVQRDIEALRAWAERYRGPAERASRAVNNAYLKSQGEREGVRSYGRMVDLLIAERRARR